MGERTLRAVDMICVPFLMVLTEPCEQNEVSVMSAMSLVLSHSWRVEGDSRVPCDLRVDFYVCVYVCAFTCSSVCYCVLVYVCLSLYAFRAMVLYLRT